MVHVFVVTPRLGVVGEDRVGKALHHFAVESRKERKQGKAAVEIDVERIEERIVGAFADKESVVLVPDARFGDEAQRVERERAEVRLLLPVLGKELRKALFRGECAVGFAERPFEFAVEAERFREHRLDTAKRFRVEDGVLLERFHSVQTDVRKVENRVEQDACLGARLQADGDDQRTGDGFAPAIDVLHEVSGNASAVEGTGEDRLLVVAVEERLGRNVHVVLRVPGRADSHAAVEVAFGKGMFVVEFDALDHSAVGERRAKFDALRIPRRGNEHKGRILDALAVFRDLVAAIVFLHLHERHFADVLGRVHQFVADRAHGKARNSLVVRHHVAVLVARHLDAFRSLESGAGKRIFRRIFHLLRIVAVLAQEYGIVSEGGRQGSVAFRLFAEFPVEEVDENAAVEFGRGRFACVDHSLRARAEFRVPAEKRVPVRFEELFVGENLGNLFQRVLLVRFRKERVSIRVLQRVELVLAGKFEKVPDCERAVLSDDRFAVEHVQEAQVVRVRGANLNARNHAGHGRCPCRSDRVGASDAADSDSRRRRRRGKRRVPGLDKLDGEPLCHQVLDRALLLGGFQVFVKSHEGFLWLKFFRIKSRKLFLLWKTGFPCGKEMPKLDAGHHRKGRWK